MGVYLSEPMTQKTIKEGKGKDFTYCMAEMQGWRKNMEDASIYNVDIGDGNSLFAVFDGHGGTEVSKFVQKKFVDLLIKLQLYKKGQYQKALDQAFKLMDQLINSQEGEKQLKEYRGNVGNSYERVSSHTGCTANVILITKDHYIIANAGDSRSVLCRNGKAIQLSFDHKPQSEIEEKRIKQAGGQISMGRVNGGLNLTRSFGDFDYKQNKGKTWKQQMITSCPDTKKQVRNKDTDQFIIMGCDGIWQKYVQNSQGLIDLIKTKMQEGKQNKPLLQQVLNELLAKDTTSGYGCDNMTSVLIKFNRS